MYTYVITQKGKKRKNPGECFHPGRVRRGWDGEGYPGASEGPIVFIKMGSGHMAIVSLFLK